MMRLNVRIKRTIFTPYIHLKKRKYEATEEPNWPIKKIKRLKGRSKQNQVLVPPKRNVFIERTGCFHSHSFKHSPFSSQESWWCAWCRCHRGGLWPTLLESTQEKAAFCLAPRIATWRAHFIPWVNTVQWANRCKVVTAGPVQYSS